MSMTFLRVRPGGHEAPRDRLWLRGRSAAHGVVGRWTESGLSRPYARPGHSSRKTTLSRWRARRDRNGRYRSFVCYPDPHGRTERRLRLVHRLSVTSAQTSVPFKSAGRICARAQAFIPPSTVRFAPVMYEASGP